VVWPIFRRGPAPSYFFCCCLPVQEVGADDYNTALCLTGLPRVIGSNQSASETPECRPAPDGIAYLQAPLLAQGVVRSP